MNKKIMIVCTALAGSVITSNVVASDDSSPTNNSNNKPSTYSAVIGSSYNSQHPSLPSQSRYGSSATNTTIINPELEAVTILARGMKATVPQNIQSVGLQNSLTAHEYSTPDHLRQAVANTFAKLYEGPAHNCSPDSAGKGSAAVPASNGLSGYNDDHKHSEELTNSHPKQVDRLETTIQIVAGIGAGTALLLNKSQSRWSYAAAPLAAVSVATGLKARTIAVATRTVLENRNTNIKTNGTFNGNTGQPH